MPFNALPFLSFIIVFYFILFYFFIFPPLFFLLFHFISFYYFYLFIYLFSPSPSFFLLILFGGHRRSVSYHFCDCLCYNMFGRRSLFLHLEEYDSKIECTLSKIRAKKCDSKKSMVELQTPLPKQPKEYFTPATYDSPTSTHMPTIMGPFEIKHSLIQILLSFYGLESENSFKHVAAFLEICSTVFLNNVSNDAFRLWLFPFSLKDKAKVWLDTKSNITTWDQM